MIAMRFPSQSAAPRFSTTSPPQVHLKAVYSVPELARMANVHRNYMQRLLESAGVEMARSGRSLVVYQAELEERMPRLWEGMVALAGFGAMYAVGREER